MKCMICKGLLFAALLALCSCDEEVIRQIPVDNVAPQQVTDVQVENLPGKVQIKYALPDETDLLYVKAVYTNTQGEVKEVKASCFKNTLEILGFGLSKKQTISLVSVDRSQNESEPVLVEIEPLDSPIYEVLNSLTVTDSWGGVKFTWENPEEEELVVEVLSKDEDGVYQSFDAFYSSFATESRAIRGLDTIPYHLAYYIRDAYGNYTDTLESTQVPLYEIELPGKEFKECALSVNFELSIWGHGFAKLWDYDYKKYFHYIAPGPTPEPYFTFDMQKTYLLSRFKVWPRQGYEFGLHNPKDYEIWGSNDPDADRNPESWEGWEKLIECHEYVPSGNPPSSATPEDKTYFNNGQEYEFPNVTKGYRFLRFKVVGLSWSGSTGLHISELRFWGKEFENN